MTYILHGNFGNDTIALIESFDSHKQHTHFVSIDTGFANPHWQERVLLGEALAKAKGFQVERLKASANFAELVLERGYFPAPQFQWCANFLKGLTLLNWLDQVDPLCEAVVVLPKRQVIHPLLTETLKNVESLGGRDVLHPIWQMSDQERDLCIAKTDLTLISHRSLECDLCINSGLCDWQRVAEQHEVVDRIAQLEAQLKQTMFDLPIEQKIAWAKQQAKVQEDPKALNMGCGSPYSCGE